MFEEKTKMFLIYQHYLPEAKTETLDFTTGSESDF